MNITSRPKHFQMMAIVAIILGIILVAYPTTSLFYIVITIGALLILSSTASIIEYYKLKKERKLSPSSTLMFNSVVSIIVGSILVTSPLFFIGFLLTILSVLLFIVSLGQLVMLWDMRTKGVNVIGYIFIVPSLLLITSTIMIFAPINSASTITMMFGLGIIFYSAMELYSYSVINKRVK